MLNIKEAIQLYLGEYQGTWITFPSEVLYYWWNSKKKQPLHKEKAVGPGLLTLALLIV